MRFCNRLTEPLILLAIALRVKLEDVYDWLYVMRRHDRSSTFRMADQALRRQYRFRNPYCISRRFLETKGADDIHSYGETPIRTFETLMRQCDLDSNDHVFELGCGRGRLCFLLRATIGCSVSGIEAIPTFTRIAEEVRSHLQLDGISFYQKNFLEVDFSEATFLYLCGTCLPDAEVEALARHLELLAPGTRILSISYPLTDFAVPGAFKVIDTFPARFPWGSTDAYLQKRTGAGDFS